MDIEIESNGIIQIHIGNAGVSIANYCWELYSREHNINNDGIIASGNEGDNPFYTCSDTGKITARSIMIDTEPNSIDDIRLGPNRKLFDKNNMICGKGDSGNIYACGYYENSKLFINEITDVINGLAEKCTNLEGFLIFRALGGGTGSGLGAQIMEHLDYCFPKILKYEFVIFPSPSISPSVVEVYNAVLSTHATMELSNCTISIDNDAVHEICLNSLDIDPGYKHLNHIIGQVVTAFTSTFRFEGVMNCKYSEVNTELVPYPIVHFPTISYAPMYSTKKSIVENLSCTKLTNLLFESKYQLLKFNPLNSKYISVMLLYRGNLTITDINATIEELKSKSLDYLKVQNYKYSLNNMTPIRSINFPIILTKNDVCLLGNNCSIREAWKPIIKKFNIMCQKKAFLYHFTSAGLNESEFQEAKNDIYNLMEEYKDLEKN